MSLALPYAFARKHQLLLAPQAHGLTLWHTAQVHASAWSEVLRTHAVERFEQVPAEELLRRIEQAYGQAQHHAARVMHEVQDDADIRRLMQDLPAVEDLLDSAADAPIVRMLNALLTQAVREGASDIHIEPHERSCTVRFRIDGQLREVVQPPRALHAALISRLKIMAELDIAEKRLPQDGRLALRLGQRAIDVRVSTLPNAHGERAVLRLLDKSEDRLNLATLGLSPEHHALLLRWVHQPHGIVLVTGPTGSGKTTTLYAALRELADGQLNILTVEDPIEYELPHVGQTQVNPAIDLTFATALRAILRQDPDVILIGEIRDQETARIAVQASLTGHLVLATLHTNDAVSAITRLTDMGIEPYLLSSSLIGVMAQRLVRKLCVHCHGAGCAHCGQQGYAGRTGIHEMLDVDEGLRALIHAQASEAHLMAHAQAKGFRPLVHDGERLKAQGLTSAEEILRVTRD
ncbi:MAG: type II secretion system protein GspE [Betaproteobacteria bacterium]|jgi:general secretion pathway protein E|nr:type II secretion system protein GspE [Betaproteobacteria bacterium]NBP45965.1 type II secretion system protein GspE [Betaproteobacteria bacterium]